MDFFYDKTCSIYAYETVESGTQKRQGFSSTALYSGDCDYWSSVGSGRVVNDIVVQDDKRKLFIDLPLVVTVPLLSKVVLDNGRTLKVVDSNAYNSLTDGNNTLLLCEVTDG